MSNDKQFCQDSSLLALRSKLFRWIELLAIIAIVLLYGWATFQRTLIWEDNFTLWPDVVKKSLQKARPHILLGLEYQKKGLINEAIVHYKTALTLKPYAADAADTHNNLGLCYLDKGLLNEAIQEFQNAIKIIPNHIKARNNLGFFYFQMKEYKKALEEFHAILIVDPSNDMARSLMYLCQMKLMDNNPVKQ